MDELVLRLLPDNQEPQELVLQQHRLSTSILDTANATSAYVFNDYKYRAQIMGCHEEIKNLVFLLNGKEVGINYVPDTGMIYFQDYSFGQRIFLECYGFVQITIIFDDAQGNQQIKDTEYIHVLVRKGRQNESVRRMTEYVYMQNADLLHGDRTLPKDVSGLKESTRKTIESHILLLKQISVTYEENYRYFRMNSRFVTTPKERVDHFEKLQYVSRNTLQYIAQHPEELQRVYHSSGIQIGSFRYQPNKTLITDNEKSYDIYENRVVLGFLAFLVREIVRIEKELSEVVSRVPFKIAETDGYVTSSYFIYEKTIDAIKILLGDIRDLHRRFTSLYYLYAEIFPIKPETISAVPKFTPLFSAIPQYHQVFDCIVAWFSKGVFTISEEQFMLSFIKISTLYEVYVLAKLINYFKNNGYALLSTDKVQYPSPSKYYENTYCNNCFVFKSDFGRITVYYQPVIYSTNRKDISGIGLYRNTSISFPKAVDGISGRGRHYTPDFLIKYEYAGQSCEKYLIMDAKFSRVDTVKKRELAKLAYKYLFSISPISKEEHIIGMCIFNGISESESQSDGATNIYDFELANPIMPFANIVTLTENAVNNTALHDALLKNAVGLFVTETIQKPVPLPVCTSVETPKIPTDNTTHVDLDVDLSSSIHEHSPRSSATIEIEELSSPINSKQDQTVEASGISSKKNMSANIKKKKKATIELSEVQLSELNLDKDLESRLLSAGYVTLKDLVPNKAKNDLLSNSILNRKNRREIEAKLKQRKVHLR